MPVPAEAIKERRNGMSFICDRNIKIAYDRSDEILQNVPYAPNQMIDTNLIVACVRERYCPVIELYTMSFRKVKSANGSMKDCGAMMRIEFDGKPNSASIILNSDMPGTFQRFSLMQQIGHLVTLPPDAQLNPDNFHVSTHINYDLSSITEEELESDYYLMREQVANIFALRVLMPDRQFYRVMRELEDIRDAAVFFGLTKDAVISRMMIGA